MYVNQLNSVILQHILNFKCSIHYKYSTVSISQLIRIKHLKIINFWSSEDLLKQFPGCGLRISPAWTLALRDTGKACLLKCLYVTMIGFHSFMSIWRDQCYASQMLTCIQTTSFKAPVEIQQVRTVLYHILVNSHMLFILAKNPIVNVGQKRHSSMFVTKCPLGPLIWDMGWPHPCNKEKDQHNYP